MFSLSIISFLFDSIWPVPAIFVKHNTRNSLSCGQAAVATCGFVEDPYYIFFVSKECQDLDEQCHWRMQLIEVTMRCAMGISMFSTLRPHF